MSMSSQNPQAPSSVSLGLAGRIAKKFQNARITPLLAIVALLMGVYAVVVTPREEEPQINVTMANVIVPFPGASAADVESLLVTPAERVLSQMTGVEHVMSVSRPGVAILTVQFMVGVPRTEALVRLHDQLIDHRDWLPKAVGVFEPIIKPKGIDDVPTLAVTLVDQRASGNAYDLERIAHSVELELKRVRGTREVTTIGGPGRAINVEINPQALHLAGITLLELEQILRSANMGMPAGKVVNANQQWQVDAGEWLKSAQDVADLVIGTRQGRLTYLSDVATVRDGAPPNERYVWFATKRNGFNDMPAVTLAITKKSGENAVEVTSRLRSHIERLQGTVIPEGVMVSITRDYGQTANEKALKLIEKLLFATTTVVLLVLLTMGRKEALIVGTAVALTLTATLFASWAYGFTLNRVSLFALIFSIGILVDDAIVVVENIHRHRLNHPDANLLTLIPSAVDEVGGPTILATLTVIAALLPMAFVSGLMGPYMGPIPINASMGMLISLAIAFVLTPWMALHLFQKPGMVSKHDSMAMRLTPWIEKIYPRFLHPLTGRKQRHKLWAGILALIALSLLLPSVRLVILKMLPFDNKSEFEIVVDMPVGTPLERTAEVLHELTQVLAKDVDVRNYQAYAGTASPINFNGLVRQYDLRQAPELGDIQVNLLDRSERTGPSHGIATRVRPALQAIAAKYGAKVKVIEVPPGPPVLAPIVAEVYGPTPEGRQALTAQVAHTFQTTAGVVDVDSTVIAQVPRDRLIINEQKAMSYGVTPASIVGSLHDGMSGSDVSYVHDGSIYPVPIRVGLAAPLLKDLTAVESLDTRSQDNKLLPIGSLVTERADSVEQPIYHKDLLPVSYVVGDMAGKIDSPLYGMFQMRNQIKSLLGIDGQPIVEYFVSQPIDAFRGYAIKWDGEWQVTYETFRDMGAAYAVGLVLIYLLVVAQFGSYGLPLIIMAPIPLTIIGVMPGHALLGAPFTATSMIGMIALAGIIVRNSILLVDFIRLQTTAGMALSDAVMASVATRAQPIILTALAAMMGAFFILDDPIFNGLAISLIFGILVSTILTLLVIPLMYFAVYSRR